MKPEKSNQDGGVQPIQKLLVKLPEAAANNFPIPQLLEELRAF
jgi:hypothetical protein